VECPEGFSKNLRKIRGSARSAIQPVK
jgi:hypothetical protein